jgi:hypothetical protein
MTPVPSSITQLQRLFKKVKQEGTCWVWHGTIFKGNCLFAFTEADGKKVPRRVQRVMYALFRTEPTGDYRFKKTCGNKRCVNPDHLVLRSMTKDVCINGHPYDKENSHVLKNGARQCRACGMERWRTWYQNQKNKLAAA